MTVEARTKELTAHPLVRGILDRLRRELASDLYYHSAAHSEDVVREAILLGVTDQLSERELLLLAIAAAYHDAGFLVRREENELLAADMAVQAMRQHGGFTEAECQQVFSMIEDTIVRVVANGLAEVPRSKLAGYLLDADLSNLGRPDFDERRALIDRELIASGKLPSVDVAAQLFRAHRWHTPAGRALRDAQKQKNIAAWQAETGIRW